MSDRLHRQLLDALPDAVVACDAADRVVYFNAAARLLLGWGDELLGASISSIVPERLRLVSGQPFFRHLVMHAAVFGGRALQAPVLRKEGVEVEVELAATVAGVGDDEWIVASLRRLREAVRVDQTQRPDGLDPGETYRLLFDNAPLGILHFDHRGVITAANDQIVRIVGTPRRVLVGLSMLTLPDPRMLDCVRSALNGRAAGFEGEYRSATSGKVSMLRVDLNPIVDTDGRVRGGVGLFEDATERIRAAEALRRSEASFRTLIEGAPDSIAVHRDGKFVYVNPALARSLGYQGAAELVGRPVADVILSDEGPGDRVRELLSAEARGLGEVRMRRRDGETIITEIASLPIHFDGESAVVLLGRDVTERKLIQGRLVLADRMASVGTLAAGVAHEINNPLAYVMASLDMSVRKLGILRKTARGDEATLTQIASSIDNAREGAERVCTIVRDLRTFSRAGDDRKVLVDVERVLDSTVNMAWNEIRKHARLVKDYGAVSAVWGDESRLGQVFLNLLVNAAQAIPEGTPQSHEIRVVTRDQPGARVSVEVRDTGAGIPAELLGRIFDPFVTTKPVGEGTGLGLSICHGIVGALGGEITVESQLGRGSVFRVLLPARGDKRHTPPVGIVTAPLRRRILIIDDERLLARALGKELGERHEVVLAESGKEAVELLLHDDRFDLVLCDVSMPGMNGAEVYEEIKQARPGVHERFAFMTGGTFADRSTRVLEKLPNPRLEKPFHAAEVDALLRPRTRASRSHTPR